MFHSRALVHASSQSDVEAQVKSKSRIHFFSALSRSITASSVLPSPPLISVSSCHFVPSGRVSIRVSLFPRVECRRSPIVPLAAGGSHPRHPPRLSFACCRSGVLLRHSRAVSLSLSGGVWLSSVILPPRSATTPLSRWWCSFVVVVDFLTRQ
jgi:hypothetical protein